MSASHFTLYVELHCTLIQDGGNVDISPHDETEGEPSSTPSAKRQALFPTPGPLLRSQDRQMNPLCPVVPDGEIAHENVGPPTSPTALLQRKQKDAGVQTNYPPSSFLPHDGEQSLSSELDDDLPCLLPECTAGPKTPKETAIDYIEVSKYRLAFRLLCLSYPAAKKALSTVTQEIIKEEVKSMKRNNHKKSGFSQPISLERVEEFRWEKLLDETEKVMPVAISSMSAMMPSIKEVKANNGKIKGKKGAKRCVSDDEAKVFITRRLGQMVAIGMFSQAPRIFKFVQTCMGIELWRQGVSQKVFKTLNHSGITINANTVRLHVDVVAQNHDQQLKEWKKTVEELPTKTTRRKLKFSPSAPTFGLCIDNVQKGTESKHQGLTRGNKFFLQTMCYAAKDRVPPPMSSSTVLDAETLDPFVFLPSPDVMARHRMRLVDVVASIMGKHMTYLEDLSRHLPITQEHEESAAMSKKSEMVTLGVVNANPSTTQGMVTVLQHLQQYVPEKRGSPIQTLVSGDGLTIERILHAQRARSNGENWKARLDAFTPAPQEFHKEILLLQDSNNVFFRGKSISAKGTIAQLKYDYNHNSFRKDVMQNVQHTWDMYEFVTEGYTLLCALKFCGTSSLNEVPYTFPVDGSKMEQLQWVKGVAQQVVDFVYHEPDKSSIQVAAEAYKDDVGEETEDALAYCHCKTEKDEEMVQCCSYACHKAWFHLGCVGLASAPDDDWYCSADCESSPSYVYCVCKLKVDPEGGTRMVQCALQRNCKGHEWYHYRCVGLQVTDVLPDKWYCGEACALDSEDDDHVLNHSKAITLEGLRHQARRAAVRAGNGPVMVDDWKIDLLSFWSKRHPKYLINAHYFLACVGGFAPQNTRTSLIWNRVINVAGRRGGNIGMDLATEHINLEYKETINHCRGNVTERHADRCAKMSGPFGRYLDDMFSDAGIVSMKTPSRKRAENLYKQDVLSFVSENQRAALFEYLPFREHDGFEGFDGRHVVKAPCKLGQKLKALSRRMDAQRRTVQLCRNTDSH
ncbi:uncharacterized protein [Diadema antillarum]|uniref:uncharacterized protein n=1 Tax=Diadema antillarum TaxID=105358 RepID=UPI003A88DC50